MVNNSYPQIQKLEYLERKNGYEEGIHFSESIIIPTPFYTPRRDCRYIAVWMIVAVTRLYIRGVLNCIEGFSQENLF